MAPMMPLAGPPTVPALMLVDYQNDFCDHGSLAVPGGLSLLPAVRTLLGLSFRIIAASVDFHPAKHVSFESSHPADTGLSFTVSNPFNAAERTPIPLWPAHCVAGTWGANLTDGLDPGPIDFLVRKGRIVEVEEYSAFGSDFSDPSVRPPVVDDLRSQQAWTNAPDDPPIVAVRGGTPVCRPDGNPRDDPALSSFENLLKTFAITDVYFAGLALDVCVKTTARHALDKGWRVWIVRDAVAPISPTGWTDTEKELAAVGGDRVRFISLADAVARLGERTGS